MGNWDRFLCYKLDRGRSAPAMPTWAFQRISCSYQRASSLRRRKQKWQAQPGCWVATAGSGGEPTWQIGYSSSQKSQGIVASPQEAVVGFSGGSGATVLSSKPRSEAYSLYEPGMALNHSATQVFHLKRKIVKVANLVGLWQLLNEIDNTNRALRKNEWPRMGPPQM